MANGNGNSAVITLSDLLERIVAIETKLNILGTALIGGKIEIPQVEGKPKKKKTWRSNLVKNI